ncbi:hypothetical protein [Clostridium sp. K25]|uniref:hypothetical protein n=1 Tax=Clostridium sp. K25 TaxID=1443109 RepID=UPI00069E0E9C|nr:hypothetical protein [Clostridium sp. K25]
MQRSSFFNAVISKEGVPDRSYLAEDFARYFSTFIGNGVFPNPSSQLQVVATDDNMNIRLKKGFAWINGYMYENTDDYILMLDVADGVLDRIDRVVLRLDFLKRTIEAIVKKGDWSSTAKAKDLQRDSDAYEIALADIKVSKGAISISQQDITDLRFNKELCGLVHATVEQIDSTVIFNQFQDWYSQKQEIYDKDITNWTKEKKEAFEEWYSKNTQEFLNQFQSWYTQNTKVWEEQWGTWFKNTSAWKQNFNNWFDTIKKALDGDTAGNLLNKINSNTDKINSIEKNVQTTLEENNSKITNLERKTTQEIKDFKQEVSTQYEDCVNEIGNIKDLKTTNKDNLVESVNELFTNVDNGKYSLYSAIIDKKITPRSKDFSDLTEAVKNIKLGQGNAQASEVLEGRTFTNDTGLMQSGTMKNLGSVFFEPSATMVGTTQNGYVDKIHIKGLKDLSDDKVQKIIKDTIENDGNSKKKLCKKIIGDIAPLIKDNVVDILKEKIPKFNPLKRIKLEYDFGNQNSYGEFKNIEIPYNQSIDIENMMIVTSLKTSKRESSFICYSLSKLFSQLNIPPTRTGSNYDPDVIDPTRNLGDFGSYLMYISDTRKTEKLNDEYFEFKIKEDYGSRRYNTKCFKFYNDKLVVSDPRNSGFGFAQKFKITHNIFQF